MTILRHVRKACAGIAFAGFGAAAMVAATGCSAQAQVSPVWTAWIANLQSQGYAVSQGSAYQFTSAYCQKEVYPVFKSCFASDPEDPYLQPLVPQGAGYLDPYYQQGQILPDGTVVNQMYHLDPTEALIVIVRLPPAAAYFGYQSYLFTRPAADYPNGVGRLSPDPARAFLFATFNNSINDVAIQNQSGIKLGLGTVAFITTANSLLNGNLISSFAAVGGDTTELFPEAMGSNLNMGLDQTTDDFTTVVRYSVPKDDTAGNNWRAHAAANIQVYRIGQPAGQSVVRYGSTPLANKAYNVSETSEASAQAELSTLLQGWLATYEDDPAVQVTQSASSEKVNASGVALSGLLGPYCIATGSDCGSDEQDTASYWAVNVGKLPAGRMFIVDGVNHSATNNATFTSVGASDATRNAGVAGAVQTNGIAAGFNTGVLTGSALQVLQDLGLYSQASQNLRNALPTLFVHIFTRPCDQAQLFCTQPYTTSITGGQLPLQDRARMTERAYVLPGYLNGANPHFLVNPDVVY